VRLPYDKLVSNFAFKFKLRRYITVVVLLTSIVSIIDLFPLDAGPRQGLTLVHISAQLEPCMTQENTINTP
jgi:hypothetical protein